MKAFGDNILDHGRSSDKKKKLMKFLLNLVTGQVILTECRRLKSQVILHHLMESVCD